MLKSYTPVMHADKKVSDSEKAELALFRCLVLSKAKKFKLLFGFLFNKKESKFLKD